MKLHQYLDIINLFQKLRFYDPAGNWILSSADDRQVRISSISSRNLVSNILGQKTRGHMRKLAAEQKNLDRAFLPPVVDFDLSELHFVRF